MVIFERFARLLLPADGSGDVVETDARWGIDRDALDRADVAVWGRPPLASGAGLGSFVAFARDRRRAITRLAALDHDLEEVVRWSPPEITRTRFRQRAKNILGSGVAVALSRRGRFDRALDAAWGEAGFDGRAASGRPASGGSLTIHARRGDDPVIFRAGLAGSPVDPERSASTLEVLRNAGVARVPIPLARGRSGAAGWSVETRLEGERPGSLAHATREQVTEFCASLPRSEGPPRAFERDAETVRRILPTFSAAVDDLIARHLAVVNEMPAIVRHGDLWIANLLVAGDRLTGVVDWDASHPSGVPGTDLLHLEASIGDGARLSLGERFERAPWRSERFVAGHSPYWSTVGVDASRAAVADAIGVAWWIGQVAANLERLPHLADNRSWVDANVRRPLGAD